MKFPLREWHRACVWGQCSRVNACASPLPPTRNLHEQIPAKCSMFRFNRNNAHLIVLYQKKKNSRRNTQISVPFQSWSLTPCSHRQIILARSRYCCSQSWLNQLGFLRVYRYRYRFIYFFVFFQFFFCLHYNYRFSFINSNANTTSMW